MKKPVSALMGSALAATAAAMLVVGSPALAEHHEATIVHAGRLLAVPGEEVQRNKSVIIRDGMITEIRDGFATAADIGGAAVIYDLSDQFVLPGLIDSHVHITSELGPRQKLAYVEMSDPDVAFEGVRYARKTLMAGFTTARDVGAYGGDAVFALRDAIARGDVPGPRLFASGNTISPTGGHGQRHGFRDEILEVMKSTAVCNGPYECRDAVRLQVNRGADHIKLVATGGVLSETAAGTGQQFFDDELEAIIATAHSMGRKVTAHAHGADGIEAALRAGVDSIEHGTYATDATFRLFRRTGAYLVPTIIAGVTVAEYASAPDSFMPPSIREKALQVGPQILDMTRRAHAAGVKIAFGTDSGVGPHGTNPREFLLLVEAGLTPEEAIIAATVNAADHLGMSDRLGAIEVGKFGDLIAVDGDPLADINELMDVDFVMKEGVAYKGVH
ncbi:MAG: amidohydrolase family protein [Parvularculaceae bacterium]